MTEIKKVNINMSIKDYNRAIEYKKTHGRPTWMEMVNELIDIKEAEEQGD